MAGPGRLGVEGESVRAVFRSPLAEAPLLLVAKSPPKWLPQKTQAGPGVWPAETTAPAAGGTHHVGQAAELLQPQEHPLDGLLHLLRLKDSVLEVSERFPGRQVPFIFKKSKLNVRVIRPIPSRPTFPLQNLS